MDYKTDFVDGEATTLFGKLHFKHHNGPGKTLVFLHGLGSNTLSWNRLMEFVPGNFNVYLVDLMGHGGSDAPHISYSVKNQSLALADFVKAEKLGNIYMIGHSYGGWIAAYFASTNDVKGLVLEDAAGLKIAFDQVRAAKRQEEYKQVFFKGAMEMEGNKDYVIKSVLDAEFAGEELDDEILGRINEPTLIVWGAKDILLNPTTGNILQSKIQGSRLEMVEDAGHVPHFTRAEEFSVMILEFISTH